MKTNRRTEILLKALELMSDKDSEYLMGMYASIEMACNNKTEYITLWSWLNTNIVNWDSVALLRLQEKQTLLCLAIAINEQR